MDSMQADALRRVQEMQSSANSNNGGTQNRRGNHTPPSPRGAAKPQGSDGRSKSEVISNSEEARGTPSVGDSSLKREPESSSLFADKEKLLILALILILSGEDSCDPTLTLALLYLII